MPCGICHEQGHFASRCNSPVIDHCKRKILQTISYNSRYYSNLTMLPGYAITQTNLYSDFTARHDLEYCRNIILNKRSRHLSYQKYNCMGNFRCKFDSLVPLPLLKKCHPSVIAEVSSLHPGSIERFINNNRDSDFIRLRKKGDFITFYGRFCHMIGIDMVPSSYLDMSQYTEVNNFRILDWSIRDYPTAIQEIAREIVPDEDDRRRLFDAVARETDRMVDRRAFNRLRNHRAAQARRAPTMSIKMIEPRTKMFNEGDCPICFEESTNTVSLSCNHSICGSCMVQFLSNKGRSCPCCRDQIKELQICSNVSPSIFNELYCKINN